MTSPTAIPQAGAAAGAPILSHEERVELCSSRIVRSEGIPPFSHNAQEVIARSVDPEAGLVDMTRTIVKDVGLSSHVLRVANSSLYNRSGKPILSVAHCVSLLGADTVRQHVSAMRFMEQYLRLSPGLRELAAMSLLTAGQGRLIAGMVGYPNPEEAYICSLFGNLGELLAARYCPAEYARVMVMVQELGVGERVACMRHLGFSWHELGARVSAAWNLPDKVRMCIEARDAPAAARRAEDTCLCSIAGYSHELTEKVYRTGRRKLGDARTVLFNVHGRKMALRNKQVQELIEGSFEDTSRTLEALQVPVDILKLEKQAALAQELIETGALDSVIAPGEEAAPEPGEDAEFVLACAMAELLKQLAEPEFEISAFISSVLDALYRSGCFERAIFGLVTQNRESLVGRLGAGNNIREALGKFSFMLKPADVLLTVTLQRHQALEVRRHKDGRFERSRLVAALEPQMFCFYPVVADGLAVGCLYVDSQQEGAMLPDWVKPHLVGARALIAAALERVRSSANGAGVVQAAG